jgi:hypothetical protein
MNGRVIIATISVSLALITAAAADTLTITETGETFNDLKATFNGSPLSVALTGAADAWTLELPSGYAFDSSLVGTNYFMPEPENASLFNEVQITQPTFMLFSSEIPSNQTFGTSQTNPFTLPDGGLGPTGAAFDLVVADAPLRPPPPGVPDASSTLSLLGLALAGVACFARKINRRRVMAGS